MIDADLSCDIHTPDNTLLHLWKTQKHERARKILLTRYKPLLLSEVNKILKGKTLSTNHKTDLLQEASMAFCQAMNSHDPARGAGIGTWAKIHIQNQLKTYVLQNRGAWSIGKNSDDRKAYYAALRRKAQKQDGVLNDEDIAHIHLETGVPKAAAKRVVENLQHTECTTDTLLTDSPCVDTHLSLSQSRNKAMIVVRQVIAQHSTRERDIFLALCLPDQPDKKDISRLAQNLNVTPTRIHQIRRNLLQNLKTHLENAGIKSEDIF